MTEHGGIGDNVRRALIDMSPAWFWATDAEYCLTFLSQSFYDIHNVPPERMHGLCILNQSYGAKETEAGLADYMDALRRKVPIAGYTYERIFANGRQVVMMDSVLPQFDAQGRFTGVQGISIDLGHMMDVAGQNGSLVGALRERTVVLERTLSKRNAELKQSAVLMNDVIDAMGEGLLVTSTPRITDPDNRILFVNPAYRALFGLDEREVYAGMKLSDLTKILARNGDLPQIDDVDAALNDGGAVKFAIPSQNRVVYSKSAPRPGGGLVLVHTDVTELERRNARLEAARRQAEEANQTKSNFLASMSHEIRTPMNGIVGLSDLLAESDLDETQALYVETIRSSALALNRLITDILDLSKAEAGRMDLLDQPFDLRALMTEISALLLPMARAKGLDWTLDIDDATPTVLQGDAGRIRQVLLNLTGNAIKFTETGEVRITCAPAEAGGLIFEVSDTGIGIPEERVATIFEPFEQVSAGLDRAYGGTGLGLAISRHLVEAMGGSVAVASTRGKGSTFTLHLPRCMPTDAAPPGGGGNDTGLQAQDLCGLNVLVVEDNRTNQMVVASLLKRGGAEVTVVEDGPAALDHLALGTPDVILMDVSMPGMTGLEATRIIRAREAEREEPHPVPIIALTGNAQEADRRACFEAGMDDYLSKPVRMTELLSAVGRMREGRRSAA